MVESPTFDTWTGHGRPKRGVYYGITYPLGPAGIGIRVTVRATSAGSIRIENTALAQVVSIGASTRFWFVPAPGDSVTAAVPPPIGASPAGCDMLLARYTWTTTGKPLTTGEVRAEVGAHVHASTRPGWFWTPTPPRDAATIRSAGHRTVGPAVTTWIPPQRTTIAADHAEPSKSDRAVRTARTPPRAQHR